MLSIQKVGYLYIYSMYRLSNTPYIRLADFHELDNLYIFCTKPPAYLLFKPSRSKSRVRFDSLDEDIPPILPFEASITVKSCSVRRKQISIYLAFCLTDCKIQGATLASAILDLKNNSGNRRRDLHRKYYSTYV